MKRRICWLTFIPLLMCSGCQINPSLISGTPTQDTLDLLEFTTARFQDKTFTYNSEYHTITVMGAPIGTNIVYANNSQKEVGVYEASATLSKDGYKTTTLTATLTIIEGLKNFEGIIFNSLTIDYDGEYHEVTLSGVPEGANVSYVGNRQKEVGVYTASATVSKAGYKSKTYTTTLKIKGQQITGVVFENETVKYDGMPHSIYATNLPTGTSASYSGNGKTAKGTYTVTATISGAGYEKLVLTATLTISDINEFPDGNFDDFYFIYDNREIEISQFFENYEYKLDYNYTQYYNAVYKVNGVAKTNPTIKNVGTYNISATYSATNYVTKTIGFKITISDKIGGIDTEKTAFQFTEETKYQDLLTEIRKGNYSVKVIGYDEFDRDKDGTYEDIPYSPNISNYYVTPDAFAGRHNEDSMSLTSTDYYISKGTNYAFRYDQEYFSIEKTKIPASTYLETVLDISDGLLPFAILKESESGGFENSQVGGYHDAYGTFTIDTTNNQMVITSRTYYYHPEFNHNEVSEYTFYNIGNTKVTIPEAMKGKDSDAESLEFGKFDENGILYSYDGSYFVANVTINEFDNVYLGGGGVYTLRPEFDGIQIRKIDYDYYWSDYYVNHSNYELNVYYDNDGYYQGEYSKYDTVINYSNASIFGKINYYDDWH